MTPPKPARAALALCLSLASMTGCRDDGAPPSASSAEPPFESESPSAKIYPAPLVTGVPSDPERATLAGTGGASGRKGPPVALRILPLAGPVPAEELAEVDAPGYQLDFQVPWHEVPSTVQVRADAVRVAPLLTFHLLPESSRHPARLRVELTAGTLPLPSGTEFVTGSDVQGWLVVWPDHRSYRVVSNSALRTVLEERRVDRTPLVPVEVSTMGTGRLLARDTRRLQFTSSLGSLVLESAIVPELGDAGTLACAFFLSLLRADARPHCAPGMVPVYARYQWSKDQALELGGLRLTTRADYRTSDFALPPRLGIWKPGELPPLEGRSPLEPDNIWLEGRASSTWQVVSHHDVPLYFFVDGFPLARLEPHVTLSVRVPPGDHRHLARDWLGQVLEPGGIANGAALPEASGAAKTDGAPRPTVQYGTPPEPEIE